MNAARAGALWVFGVVLGACAVPAASERFQAQLPDRASFAPIAHMLERHCGTLDCHGQVGRNLRVYGNEGLRLSETDRPLMPACTTDDEIDQDYEAVVGLEPELMSTVIMEGGAQPERLTLVRKARGTEHHKGGAVINDADDADRCLTSWLAGATDSDACRRAVPKSDCP